MYLPRRVSLWPFELMRLPVSISLIHSIRNSFTRIALSARSIKSAFLVIENVNVDEGHHDILPALKNFLNRNPTLCRGSLTVYPSNKHVVVHAEPVSLMYGL